jgi:dTMP kinase
VYGDLVARFLRGELGALDQVNPYLVALIYAGDRAEAASMIRSWLDEGKFVIVDRYVYSNVGYQCAKVDDPAEREQLRQWIVDLEYQHNAIPQPDLSLFLDVPFSFTQRKLTEQRDGDDRQYLHGKQDIHEASLSLQERVRRVYLDQVSHDSRFRVIECTDEHGEMRAPEAIFERIMAEVSPLL